MKVEILFRTLGRLVAEVDEVYTSDQALCLQYPSGFVRHFPLIHIWSWTCQHQPHWATTRASSAQEPT